MYIDYQSSEVEMNIGIDIDDTMTDLGDQMLKEAIKYDISLGNSGEILNDSYYAAKKFNWNEQETRYFMSIIRKKIVCNAKLRKGLKPILNKLRNEGYKIIIITARSNYYYEDALKMTKDWLKKENIPYDKLIIEARDKAKVALEEKIDIFLDDDIINCQNVAKLNIKTFIMDNKTNYLVDNKVTRVFDFYDFYNKLNDTKTE